MPTSFARIFILENWTMPIDPWLNDDGEMDFEEVQEDVSFLADIAGVGQRAETNRLLREQAAARNRDNRLPQCWHCGGKLQGRGYRLCPHCRTELKWHSVGDEWYTPREASRIKKQLRAEELKRQEKRHKRHKEIAIERIRGRRIEFKEQALRFAQVSLYGERKCNLAATSLSVFDRVAFSYATIILVSCSLIFTFNWLLGLVGWSPSWWTQMHLLEVLGAIGFPLGYIILCTAFFCCDDELFLKLSYRLDPKGNSGTFDFFLIKADLVVGGIQALYILFTLTLMLSGFFGYAPEWWTALSRPRFYWLLLGPIAFSSFYMVITGTIAEYLRKSNESSSELGVVTNNDVKTIKQINQLQFRCNLDDYSRSMKLLKTLDVVGASEFAKTLTTSQAQNKQTQKFAITFDWLLELVACVTVVGVLGFLYYVYAVCSWLLAWLGYEPWFWNSTPTWLFWTLLAIPVLSLGLFIFIRVTEERLLDQRRNERRKKRRSGKSKKAAKYFVRRNKTIKGPFTPIQIVEALKAQKLRISDEVGSSVGGPFNSIKEQYHTIKTLAEEKEVSELVQDLK